MKIKYIIIIIIVLEILLFDFQSFSQNTFHKESKPSFEAHNVLFSFGFGTDDMFTYDFNDIYDYLGFSIEITNYNRNKTPLYFKAEFAVNDHVSLGVHLNRSFAYDDDWNINSSSIKILTKTKWTSTSIIPRFNFNFSLDRYFTVYFGFGAGYHYLSYISEDYDNLGVRLQSRTSLENETENPIAIETTFGMRYFPIKNVGLYWEFGLSKSPFQGGLVLKF